MKQIAIDLIKEMKFFSDLKCSGEGNAAMALTQMKNERYHTSLALWRNGRLLTLTGGPDGQFLFEDENTLLFLSSRDEETQKRLKDKEELSVFWRIALDGGEAKRAFELPLKVQRMQKIDDSRLLLTAEIQLDAPDYYRMSKEDREAVIQSRRDNQDYQIITQQPYYQDGAGYIEGKRSRLFLYDLKKNQLQALTESHFQIGQFQYINKNQVVFTGALFETVRNSKEGLYCLDLSSLQIKELLQPGQMSIQKIGWNGQQLFVAASDQKRYGAVENPYFYLFDLETQEIRLLYANEMSLGSAIGSDCLYGAGQSSLVDEDGFTWIETAGAFDQLMTIDWNGQKRVILKFDGAIQSFAKSGSDFYLTAMQGQKLQELYFFSEKEGLRQLSSINEAILKDTYVALPERLSISAQKMSVEGWVLKPIDYDETKRYPAILNIHGGPKAAYGEVFFHEMQYWAGQGYFVFFCNPRGSNGKGNDFAELRGLYGTIDYDDLMNFTDAVLEKYPAIDAKRLGITGGSYGGFMCNWIIGHTDRFAAAASQRSIANWVSLITYADIGFTFDSDQMAADPWSDVKKVWDQSPLQFANRAKTPTLFIHSFEDYRCLLQEGMQMYNALIHHGVEAKMCLFKGESHGLSRIGKPAHRLRRIREITEWMDNHLKANSETN